MPKSKLTAVLSLLFVFVSGALLGALAQRAYFQARPAAALSAPRRPSPAEFRKRYLADMRDRLKLDDSQTTQLTAILNSVEDEMHQLQTQRRSEDQASPVWEKRHKEDQAIQDGLVSRINAMLRPEQQTLYRQLREERERDRKLREQQKGGDRGPGGPPPDGRR